MPFTYQGKRVPKSPLVTLTGCSTVAVCAYVDRASFEPDCSPYCTRFCGNGGGVLGVFTCFCFSSFWSLPWMGMAFSSTACLAFGSGGAGAGLGLSVGSTLL